MLAVMSRAHDRAGDAQINMVAYVTANALTKTDNLMRQHGVACPQQEFKLAMAFTRNQTVQSVLVEDQWPQLHPDWFSLKATKHIGYGSSTTPKIGRGLFRGIISNMVDDNHKPLLQRSDKYKGALLIPSFRIHETSTVVLCVKRAMMDMLVPRLLMSDAEIIMRMYATDDINTVMMFAKMMQVFHGDLGILRRPIPGSTCACYGNVLPHHAELFQLKY